MKKNQQSETIPTAFRAGARAGFVINEDGGKIAMGAFWKGRLNLWRRFKCWLAAKLLGGA